jgi:hypothetical protein
MESLATCIVYTPYASFHHNMRMNISSYRRDAMNLSIDPRAWMQNRSNLATVNDDPTNSKGTHA